MLPFNGQSAYLSSDVVDGLWGSVSWLVKLALASSQPQILGVDPLFVTQFCFTLVPKRYIWGEVAGSVVGKGNRNHILFFLSFFYN